MKHDELRLELVKMLHRHGQYPQDTIDRAKEFEAYILADPETPEVNPPREASVKKKKTDNINPLS